MVGAELTRTSLRCSSPGCRGAVPSGVFDPRGAEAYVTVRRAPRGEKTSLSGVHRRPQQETGEKCGLTQRLREQQGYALVRLAVCAAQLLLQRSEEQPPPRARSVDSAAASLWVPRLCCLAPWNYGEVSSPIAAGGGETPDYVGSLPDGSMAASGRQTLRTLTINSASGGVAVPPGVSDVQLRFVHSGVRFGVVVCIVSLVLLAGIGLIWVKAGDNRDQGKPHRSSPNTLKGTGSIPCPLPSS